MQIDTQQGRGRMFEMIGSIVTGILALIGVVISNHRSNDRVEQKLETSQAVTDTKIEELTREVREHNGFAHRLPVVEQKIDAMEQRIERIERKVDEQ